MRRLGVAVALAVLAVGPAVARMPSPVFIGADPVASRAVLDGATLALADGRVLRLAGIEVPAPPTLAGRAAQALATLIKGKPLELRYAGAKTDRAGRVVAELYAGGRWVERALVRRGLARVRGAADERLGLAALLATEDAARRARRGLWRERRYRVRDAADAARDAGTWQIIAGTVAQVIPSSEGVWLVFGPDRASAFAAHIERPALKLFRTAGVDPRSFAGAALRVRGFIDGVKRPAIEVTFPEQIERP